MKLENEVFAWKLHNFYIDIYHLTVEHRLETVKNFKALKKNKTNLFLLLCVLKWWLFIHKLNKKITNWFSVFSHINILVYVKLKWWVSSLTEYFQKNSSNLYGCIFSEIMLFCSTSKHHYQINLGNNWFQYLDYTLFINTKSLRTIMK